MASLDVSTFGHIPITDNESDYGSDIDDATVDQIFSQIEEPPLLLQDPLQSIETTVVKGDDGGIQDPIRRLSRIRDDLNQALVDLDHTIKDLSPMHSTRPEPAAFRANTFSPVKRETDPTSIPTTEAEQQQNVPDHRTPIERFRTLPKKPLSVTDIISPAWCEMQYWYNLTKYGRIRRTAAMREGSTVHKTLEQEVHVEVPVEAVTKEDRFGLRIWNIITGLRTLRHTGITRELELWGVVEGEVINGIVDEITTDCPDHQLEAQLQDGGTTASQSNDRSQPTDQRTLLDFMTNSQNGTTLESGTPWSLRDRSDNTPRKVYLKDIKTRQNRNMPSATGGQLRPVHMQLMLYHRLFTALSNNSVPAARIFERYRVDPTITFSDTFIAQISQFDTQQQAHDRNDASYFMTNENDEPPPSSSQTLGDFDSFDEIISHNNLNLLWELMISEYSHLQSQISPLLTAEYVSARTGSMIGRRSFIFNAEELDAYVADEMSWWKGKRPAKGVEIEEAFKCGMCEFAEICDWRKEKLEADLKRVRSRKSQS